MLGDETTEIKTHTGVGQIGGLIGGLIGGFLFLGSDAPHQSTAFNFEPFSCHSVVWYLLTWHVEAQRGTSALQAYSLYLQVGGAMNCRADQHRTRCVWM